MELGAKISNQAGASDYLFAKLKIASEIPQHCFIAQVLKTQVKPVKQSSPRIPHMLARCCYLHVRHVFVCVCVCVCVWMCKRESVFV